MKWQSQTVQVEYWFPVEGCAADNTQRVFSRRPDDMVSRPITRYEGGILVHEVDDRDLDDSPTLDQQQGIFLESSGWGGFAEYVCATFGLPCGEEMLDHLQAYR